jgi:hypothetical protein
MTEQNQNQEPNVIEDLQVQETEAGEVKGGPAYMKLGDIKGEVQAAPTAHTPQTREHILL